MKYLLVSAAAVMAITGAAAIGNAQMQDKQPGAGASSPGGSGQGAGGGAERTQGGGGGSAERAPSGGGTERTEPGKGAQGDRGKGDSKAAQQRDQQPRSTQGTQTDKGDKMDRKSATEPRDKDQKKADQQPRQQDQKKSADQQRQRDQDKKAADQQRQQDQKKSADQQRQQQQDQKKAADQQRKGDQDKKAADQRQPGDQKAAQGGDQKRVQVSDQQRTTVREQITRDRNIQRVERSRLNVDIRVGVAFPRSVRLHTLPVTLVSTVPAYRGYSYIVLEDDTICIVDPRTYVVVDVIESGRGIRAERPGTARLTLSQEDMRFIYRTVPKERRSNVNVRLALGAEVPREVELMDFPAEIVERVPDVRRYRYVVTDSDVVIVDPNDFQVALVIND